MQFNQYLKFHPEPPQLKNKTHISSQMIQLRFIIFLLQLLLIPTINRLNSTKLICLSLFLFQSFFFFFYFLCLFTIRILFLVFYFLIPFHLSSPQQQRINFFISPICTHFVGYFVQNVLKYFLLLWLFFSW